MYTHVIFDLDGTILNTIDDLADAGNHVCERCGWPTHPVEKYKVMVGNGIPKLVERFAPEGTPAEVLEEVRDVFLAYYDTHKEDKTAPYEGISQVAGLLKAAGIRVAVLTNKADNLARPMVERYFPGLFHAVRGAKPGVPTKPHPAMLTGLLEENSANLVDRLVGIVDPLLAGILMVTVGLSLLSVMLPLIGMMNSIA